MNGRDCSRTVRNKLPEGSWWLHSVWTCGAFNFDSICVFWRALCKRNVRSLVYNQFQLMCSGGLFSVNLRILGFSCHGLFSSLCGWLVVVSLALCPVRLPCASFCVRVCVAVWSVIVGPSRFRPWRCFPGSLCVVVLLLFAPRVSFLLVLFSF